MAICDFSQTIWGRFIKYFDDFFDKTAKEIRQKCQEAERYLDEWSE